MYTLYYSSYPILTRCIHAYYTLSVRFDMGFEPQIKMILQNIRPDRQTVLFSATFPKQIEKLAKSILKAPLEIVVGERSTVNKDIAQIVSVCMCTCMCVVIYNYDTLSSVNV